MDTFALRAERKIGAILTSARLHWRNIRSSESITNPYNRFVVSLTTYGNRTRWVHLTVESIAAGEMLPGRLVLWLDPDQYARPPRSLRRLQRRGLEIREARAEWGPHKKYFPYCAAFADDDAPLVTADDDVLYPSWWLITLAERAAKDPDTIWAHRVRRVRLAAPAALAPYSTWDDGRDVAPSVGNIAIGVSGVVYPPAFQRIMRDAGTGFMEHCARADDLWLHVHAIRSGVVVGQVGGMPGHFPWLPGSQGNALALENQLGGRNDAVAAATYTAADLEALQGALAVGG